MAQTQIFRIVVASPGDVQSERDLLPRVIDELNRGPAAMCGLHCVLSRWETDAYPGFHPEGPQGLIDPILKIVECDLLIGIFWRRFGTPTPGGQTGTEHEFVMACEAWKERGRPQIFVYFNQKPYTPNSPAETEQWGKVIEFRNRFPREGLWWPYKGKNQFERLVRNHLTNYFLNLLASSGRDNRSEGLAPAGPARRDIRQFLPEHNEYFTGREALLLALDTGFKGGTHAQALSGMGGVGKTQTAMEYAYRHRDGYQIVLWGKAHTRETLVADFAAMAEPLDLPEKNAKDQGEAVSAVKRWLAENDGWLLILDNADDLKMAREFIPAGRKGHILLTTRAQATGAIAIGHEIKEMSPADGALFLLRRSKKIAMDAPIEAASANLRAQAENLSKALGGLPLALDQAAGYIEEMQSTFAEYAELYRVEGAEFRKRRGDLHDHHPESVSVTFSLAFEQVMKASPAAADLLRLCAFLDPDAIPEEIFSEGAAELGEAINAAAATASGLSQAIGEAGRFSLLRRDADQKTVTIHRLVQAVLKDGMDDETERMWAERAVRAVNEAFPGVEYATWPACERLIQHARVLATLIEKSAFEFLEAARLLNQAGYYLSERAQYAEAEPLYQGALAIREKVLGADHPETAQSLNNLALLYDSQGRYKEAEPLYQRALAILETALGSDHPDTALSLNNLAALYDSQGKYEEAEPLYQRSLAIREKMLGADHPDTAVSLNNLAGLYREQGKYEEAESLCRRALGIWEKVLGADHPFTAVSLNNLAFLYDSQGKYEEAEPLYQRSLAIREKALGSDHPKVALVLENYAGLLRKMNRDGEAAKLEARAEEIRAKFEPKVQE